MLRPLGRRYPRLCVVRLTQNYRSTPEVLGCALPVIGHNPGGARSLLPNRGSGAPVRLAQAANSLAEGIFIAKEINRMVGGMDMLDAAESQVMNASNPAAFPILQSCIAPTARQTFWNIVCKKKTSPIP